MMVRSLILGFLCCIHFEIKNSTNISTINKSNGSTALGIRESPVSV